MERNPGWIAAMVLGPIAVGYLVEVLLVTVPAAGANWSRLGPVLGGSMMMALWFLGREFGRRTDLGAVGLVWTSVGPALWAGVYVWQFGLATAGERIPFLALLSQLYFNLFAGPLARFLGPDAGLTLPLVAFGLMAFLMGWGYRWGMRARGR